MGRQKLAEKSLDPGSFKIEPAESEGDGTIPSLQKQLSNSKKEYTYLCWKYNQKKDLITLRDGEIRLLKAEVNDLKKQFSIGNTTANGADARLNPIQPNHHPCLCYGIF